MRRLSAGCAWGRSRRRRDPHRGPARRQPDDRPAGHRCGRPGAAGGRDQGRRPRRSSRPARRPERQPLMSTGDISNRELEALTAPLIAAIVEESPAHPSLKLGRGGIVVRGSTRREPASRYDGGPCSAVKAADLRRRTVSPGVVPNPRPTTSTP
jgi:hypothetical protein